MKNLISIVEIPTIEFPRAVTFYQTILNTSIEEINMEGVLWDYSLATEKLFL